MLFLQSRVLGAEERRGDGVRRPRNGQRRPPEIGSSQTWGKEGGAAFSETLHIKYLWSPLPGGPLLVEQAYSLYGFALLSPCGFWPGGRKAEKIQILFGNN